MRIIFISLFLLELIFVIIFCRINETETEASKRLSNWDKFLETDETEDKDDPTGVPKVADDAESADDTNAAEPTDAVKPSNAVEPVIVAVDQEAINDDNEADDF